MTMPSRQQLRDWNAALTLDPLDPADPNETRYVALADAGRGAVDELMATIQLAFDTTTQLLSGPNGSGKTTELCRLRGELEEAGFHAAILNIGLYINESSPIDVTEFLIALALGAHDLLGGAQATQGPGFIRRLRGMLSRLKVSLDVPGLSAAASRDGLEVEALGASLEFDLQRELKSSESVVAELRSKLTYHIGQLYDEVAAFLTTLLPTDDPGQGSVLIVDGLEKLRGSSVNESAVQEISPGAFRRARQQAQVPLPPPGLHGADLPAVHLAWGAALRLPGAAGSGATRPATSRPRCRRRGRDDQGTEGGRLPAAARRPDLRRRSA